MSDSACDTELHIKKNKVAKAYPELQRHPEPSYLAYVFNQQNTPAFVNCFFILLAEAASYFKSS